MAREQALWKGGRRDVVDRRAELARLGIVARDDKKRQYWRRSG